MDLKTLFIAFLLAFAAGAAKAVQDTVQHHHSRSVFAKAGKWWNPNESWTLKYRDWEGGDTAPAFPFSKTVLVALTDAWHCFGLLHRAALLACGCMIGYYRARYISPLAWMAACYAVMASSFHFFYTYILV